MAEATCPRCGDWTVVCLEDGKVPEHADCECDGPHGCGYEWITGVVRADLVLEIERMIAMLDELHPDHWPTWLERYVTERDRVIVE